MSGSLTTWNERFGLKDWRRPSPGVHLVVAAALLAVLVMIPVDANAATAAATGVTDITAGGAHTCSVTDQGVAHCWGDDLFGQLGNGAPRRQESGPSPVETALTFTELTAGYAHTCGLTHRGTAHCWGNDDRGQLGNGPSVGSAQSSPTSVDTDLTFTQLTAGYRHTCGLTAQGTAHCWGWDSEGQLGNGAGWDDQRSPTPVDTPLRFTQLAAGELHACGLTAEGTAHCWGSDSNGQLGNGAATVSNRSRPSPVDTTLTFTQLTAGDRHTCGLTAQGTAHCWGWDRNGQLGNGAATTDDQPSPTPVDTTLTFTQLTAGGSQTCGLAAQGTAHCWGSDSNGQLGNGAATKGDQPSPTPVDTALTFTQLSPGSIHTCGLSAHGAAYCWGNDTYGQLGTATNNDQPSPSPVARPHGSAVPRLTQIAAGGAHTCGLNAQGTAYCWGFDGDGQLGNGAATTGDQSSPSPVDTALRFTQLAAGELHACGLTAQGTAYCWGFDGDGQLGNGAATSHDQPSPTPVDTTLTFTQLTAGDRHTCGLTAQGTAYCWGFDGDGQLGNGAATTDDQPSPTPVDTTLTFTQLTAGDRHTCGLTAQGTAHCWGWDRNGQLGNGAATTDDQPSPTPVDTTLTFTQLTAGGSQTCGLAAQGTAHCWGSDSNGQLGNGAATTGDQPSPTPVDTTLTFTDVTAGSYHTCGLTAHGTAHCWGWDEHGQLGDGAPTGGHEPSPAPVDTALPFTQLTAGQVHTCGITAKGAGHCWGWDIVGQLGNGPGLTDLQPSPTAVRWPPGAPTGVTATPGHNTATVSWTEPYSGDSPITGYTVTSAPGGHTATVDASRTTATVTGLTNGTAYKFTVTASSSAGTGPASEPSNAVRPGDADSIVVSPDTASIDFGESQTYTVEAFDADGNSLGDVTDDMQLTITPDGSCTADTCTATTAGEHTVTATYATLSDTATLIVTGRIAFVSGHSGDDEIHSVTPDRSSRLRLTRDPSAERAPAWSPDRTEIAFVSNRTGDDEIYVMNAGGTDVRRVTRHAATDGQPAWSPDGTKLAFVSDRRGGDDIFIMNADGTAVKRIHFNVAADRDPAWSPDGEKLAFVSDRRGGDDIFTMNPDGTGLQRVTSNIASDRDPAWSPDGEKLAFTSDRRGNDDIFTMNPDGRDVKRIHFHSAADHQPAWSPDGTKLAFTSTRHGNNEIYVMNADGTEVRRITYSPTPDTDAAWR